MDDDGSVRPFFGSWFDVQGRKQCGYFLGHELIRQLEANMNMKEIALLDHTEEWLRRGLERMFPFSKSSRAVPNRVSSCFLIDCSH